MQSTHSSRCKGFGESCILSTCKLWLFCVKKIIMKFVSVWLIWRLLSVSLCEMTWRKGIEVILNAPPETTELKTINIPAKLWIIQCDMIDKVIMWTKWMNEEHFLMKKVNEKRHIWLNREDYISCRPKYIKWPCSTKNSLVPFLIWYHHWATRF